MSVSNRPRVPCQQCGKEFFASHWDILRGRKFCSYKCYHQSRRRGVYKVCKQCSKLFTSLQSRINSGQGKFCSQQCKALSMVTKIEQTCQWCGRKFMVVPSQIKYGKGTYCSNSCKGHGTQDPGEARVRMAKAHTGKKLTPEHIEHIAQGVKKRYLDPELRKRLSISLTEWNKDPRVRERKRQAMLGRKQTEAEKHKRSETHKKLWQDPEFVKRSMLAFQKKPTNPEKKLEAILNDHFPEFKYNGDGGLGVTLGGLTPDFVNINGKKDVIEVFGDYYHSPEFLGNRWQSSELGKIMIYNSLGWKCLVIWEHELKALPEREIVKKITNFSKRRKYANSRV